MKANKSKNIGPARKNKQNILAVAIKMDQDSGIEDGSTHILQKEQWTDGCEDQ